MNLPGLACLGAVILILSNPTCAEVAFTIAVSEDGHYRLPFEQLAYHSRPLPSQDLALYERGMPVPFQLEDGDDGVFGPGDSINFVGRRLEGKTSWYDEYSRFNIYQLRLDQPFSSVLQTGSSTPDSGDQGAIIHHIEKDILRMALPRTAHPHTAERWYWQQLSHIDKQGIVQRVEWADPPKAIRVNFAGLSWDAHAQAAGLPQHQVVVSLDDIPVGTLEWDGQDSATLEISDAPAFRHRDQSTVLKLTVPERLLPGGQPVIDAVLLNWIELEYPPEARVTGATIPDRLDSSRLLVAADHLSADRVTPAARNTGLRDPDRQADYLMISHPTLVEALQPLADYHRTQGLKVEVVDTQSIYDEFNHGIESPWAIRDFLRHAWRAWQHPAPAMVLLVGDASWDRNAERGESRNLVPTVQVLAHGQFAASDNALVTIADADWRPDLAIGRLPAGGPNELSGMISKLLTYARDTPAGNWRNRAALVTDLDSGFQGITNELAKQLEIEGVSAEKVYPTDQKNHEEQNQERILSALNRGSALVHFLGHGGRYVWRTGPRDLRNSRDLFGLEDIQSLEANTRLPLVLSMTCSSGPFDHPEADSLAEAFLRPSDRGAMGILSASWRVSASKSFSQLLLQALLEPEARIGEAIMHAKRQESNRILVESYNLLGDPALSLPARSYP